MSCHLSTFLVLASFSFGFNTCQFYKVTRQTSRNDHLIQKLAVTDDLFEEEDENSEMEELESSYEDLGFANETFTNLTLAQLTASFAANVSYFYLRDELGLSDEALWRVTYEASSVLGMKAEVIRKKVQLLRNMMDLTLDDVREVITLQPSILHLSAERNLAPTMLYLIRSLDLGKADLRKLVLNCPCILSYARTNLSAKLAFFLRLMEYTVDETRQLLMDEPRLIRCSLHGGLIPHLRFFLGSVKLTQSDLRLVIQKNPKLLLYNIERNLHPKLTGLNMTTTQTHKILKTFPQFYDYSMSRTIVPVIHYLVDDLGFTPEEVQKIVVRCPRIVSYTLLSLKNKVGFFRYEIGLSSTTVKSILLRSPGLVGTSTDKLRTKIEYFTDRLHLDEEETRKVVGSMPSLLTLNLERNVDPKIEYLSKYRINLRAAVLKLPALLAYSLERRIIPRVEALQANCVSVDKYLANALQMTDEAFSKWLHNQRKVSVKNNEPNDDPSQRLTTKRITHWTR